MRFKYSENNKLGDLYLKAETDSDKSSYLVNLIASSVKREFYLFPERESIKAFQAALLKANSILIDFPIKIKFHCSAHTPTGTFSAETKNKKFGSIKIDSQKKKSIIKKSIAPPIKPKRSLPKKTILTSYGILILFLVASLLIKSDRPANPKADLLASALEKVNQAEAILMFDEPEKARGILEQAQELAQQTNNQEIKENIDAQLDKANLITRLNNLEIFLLDFKALKITGQRDKLFVLGDDEISYQIDFNQKKSAPVGPIDFSVKYSGRTYKLTDNQILRNDADWLKEPQDLSSAIDLAIDGSIYVLLPDTIKKFYKGEEKKISLTKITNPLNNPRQIYATENHKFIYILEANRVLVYQKDGALAAQYLSPQFINLKGIHVTPDDKILYLLNNNEVLKIDITF